MYRLHSETNLIDIIHKFFFLRSRPLQLSLRILFFFHLSLTQTTSNVCVLFCFFRTSCFFSRKNYKNIQKNNLVICVCLFLLLFESRDHVHGHVTRQKGFRARTKNRLSLLLPCLPKKCVPKVAKFSNFFCWVCVSLLLLDSLNLF